MMGISQVQNHILSREKKERKQLTLNKHKPFGALRTLPTDLHSCLWPQLTGWQTLTDVTLTGSRNGNPGVTVQQALGSRAHSSYSPTCFWKAQSASACPLVSAGSSANSIPTLAAFLLCTCSKVTEGYTSKQYLLSDSRQCTKFLQL